MLAASACSTEPDSRPAGIAAHVFSTFGGTAGLALAVQPAVKVSNRAGEPLSGITVVFAITKGGGSISPSAVTDQAGIARADWIMGQSAGENAAVASVNGLPSVVFNATAYAGAPATVTFVSGTGQSGQVATPLATQPSVKVTDVYANPTAATVVQFTLMNGGSLANSSQLTNSAGIASAGTWTLGTVAGTQTLKADVAQGALSSQISASATNAAPTRIRGVTGDGQTVAAGSAVPDSITVQVVDPYDNGVSGRAVSFSIDSGTGSLSAPLATSNSQGYARLGGWTVSTKTGTDGIIATSPGLTPHRIFATVTPGPAVGIETPADTMKIAVGDSTSLWARYVDAYGNFGDEANVAWSSRNTTIVTVIGSRARGHSIGVTYLIAQVGAFKDSTRVTVTSGTP